MSTATTLQIDTDNFESTEALGAKLGARLRGGEVIELRSDVGGGKTTFVRGVASGMGSTDNVGSPSFTISREYTSGDLTLHHYDFYRLAEPGLMAQELAEVLMDPKVVVIVEWADIVDNVLPHPHSVITIQTTGETSRQLRFECAPGHEYLIESIK